MGGQEISFYQRFEFRGAIDQSYNLLEQVGAS
jgi:hypothetical protein